ncbi:MAG: DEAD/DEAH box helicase family protein, partial [Steroidobacteraceae bacterium]|nr:DEAD/DEAH box helicase family protein [Steroidobacteraceae bacterium]
MQLRPYQETAKANVLRDWLSGIRSTLLVLPTGSGKTIVFSRIIEDVVRLGGRVLVIAHRGELLQQAADKLCRTTGLRCAVEKAEETALDSWLNVVVGSVQTLQSRDRRNGHEFTHIIVDEAHHAITPSYRAILDHWPDARVLGVTATADRGDKRNLGEVFEHVAFEYHLPDAITDGYLAPIRALT